jgi:hypothetical protein
VLALLGLAVTAIGAVLLVGQQGDSESDPVSGATETSPGPSFAQPEEARRYHEAVAEGDARALEVLEEALAAAKSQPQPDPQHIERLERELAKRRGE